MPTTKSKPSFSHVSNQIHRRAAAIADAASSVIAGSMSERAALLELRSAGYKVSRSRFSREISHIDGSRQEYASSVEEHFKYMSQYD